jgi:aminopeptidase N
MVIPLMLGLVGKDGGDLPLTRADGGAIANNVALLTDNTQSIVFGGIAERPVLSINRGFSAPVAIEREVSNEDLVFLAARDDDAFARYEAMQDLVVRHLCGLLSGSLGSGGRDAGREAIGAAFSTILADRGIDDLMRGELMILPGETYLAEQMLVADPAAIRAEREGLKAWLGTTLESELAELHARASAVPGSRDAAGKGGRKVKTQALAYLAAGVPERAAAMAAAQYDAANNMTDRQGALMILASLQTPERTHKLLDFYNRFKGNALVIDKWFAIQASSLHPSVLEQVKALAGHPDFTLKNPNRVRSLYMPFTGTAQGFHAASGEGYKLIADLILALDPLNPQTAARFVPPLGRWRRIEPGRAALMRGELERIAAASKLSRDTYEQVTRSLG